jgi:hypothetical protein
MTIINNKISKYKKVNKQLNKKANKQTNKQINKLNEIIIYVFTSHPDVQVSSYYLAGTRQAIQCANPVCADSRLAALRSRE